MTSHDVEALLLGERSRKRGIDAARHGGDDARAGGKSLDLGQWLVHGGDYKAGRPRVQGVRSLISSEETSKFAGETVMVRIALLLCIAIFALAGCNEGEQRSASAPAPPPAERASGAAGVQDITVTAEMRAEKPKLAYSHDLALEMAAATVAPRFERARNACLEEAALNCSLVRASIYVGDPNTGQPPEATLNVRLPHDQIAAFEKILFARLPGEGEGEPLLRQRTTDAEDLTYAIADNDRRLAQAMDYRERLLVLSKQSGAKVADLIQIEEKLSEVQSNIER